MITFERTDSADPDFRILIEQLDRELYERYGAGQDFFAQFNTLNAIQHVVIACQGAVPAGCGAFKIYTGHTVEIKRMFVAKAFRGHGIATGILRMLEQWAAELKYSEAILETGTRQPEAIALYTRSGYTIMENYGQYAGIAESICMRKPLKK
jgi:GNAT superfamily N-acetyltransferase